METLAQKIATHAASLPEGAPVTAKGLLHLGARAAVDQALSRLARKGALLRIARGVYVRPVRSRYGAHSPSTPKVIKGLSMHTALPISMSGAAAANALRLTTQVPVREVYLTAGRSRRLRMGAQYVEIRHAPAWQLMLPGRIAGNVVRALAWLGPEAAQAAVRQLHNRLSPSERKEVLAVRPQIPTWMAQQLSALA
ncbi:MAG: AbiEi antitoxin N-terminal domain-containing protein [Terriglobales bacterium]